MHDFSKKLDSPEIESFRQYVSQDYGAEVEPFNTKNPQEFEPGYEKQPSKWYRSGIFIVEYANVSGSIDPKERKLEGKYYWEVRAFTSPGIGNRYLCLHPISKEEYMKQGEDAEIDNKITYNVDESKSKDYIIPNLPSKYDLYSKNDKIRYNKRRINKMDFRKKLIKWAYTTEGEETQEYKDKILHNFPYEGGVMTREEEEEAMEDIYKNPTVHEEQEEWLMQQVKPEKLTVRKIYNTLEKIKKSVSEGNMTEDRLKKLQDELYRLTGWTEETQEKEYKDYLK